MDIDELGYFLYMEEQESRKDEQEDNGEGQED